MEDQYIDVYLSHQIFSMSAIELFTDNQDITIFSTDSGPS